MSNNAPRKGLLWFAVVVGSGMALFSISCSGPTSPDREIVVTVSGEDFQRNHDYSGNVRLITGGTLTVKLFANTASTGYSWSNPVQISNPSVIEQTDHIYVPPSSPNPGAGGQEVWIFRVTSKGSCFVYTEYKRSSQTLPALTFTLDITVI